jgi:hypothetical protein
MHYCPLTAFYWWNRLSRKLSLLRWCSRTDKYNFSTISICRLREIYVNCNFSGFCTCPTHLNILNDWLWGLKSLLIDIRSSVIVTDYSLGTWACTKYGIALTSLIEVWYQYLLSCRWNSRLLLLQILLIDDHGRCQFLHTFFISRG